jgi:hypothetical protein
MTSALIAAGALSLAGHSTAYEGHATEAPTGAKRFGKSSPANNFPTAEGGVRSPEKLYLELTTTFTGLTAITYSIECKRARRGSGFAFADGGFDFYGPRVKRVSIPTKRPRSCILNASANLTGDGTARIFLHVKKR